MGGPGPDVPRVCLILELLSMVQRVERGPNLSNFFVLLWIFFVEARTRPSQVRFTEGSGHLILFL